MGETKERDLLTALTAGTTDFANRYDGKTIRIVHDEPKFALVKYGGGSY